MRFEAADYYSAGAASLRPGAIFLGVPIAFMPPRLPAVALSSDGRLLQQDVQSAWRTASTTQRDDGIPILARAKLRPAIVMRIGAAVTDPVYQRSIWCVPLYGETDPPRHGPNIFPLPAWPEGGLPFAGYADLYQATMLPIAYFEAGRHVGELSARAMALILGATALWAEADPTR